MGGDQIANRTICCVITRLEGKRTFKSSHPGSVIKSKQKQNKDEVEIEWETI